MEFFRDSKFDFMGARRLWLWLSVLSAVASVVVLFALGGLNLGIDFTGGTQITLKFADRPELDELRGVLSGAGIQGAQIQRFGDAESNEVILKTPPLGADSPSGADSSGAPASQDESQDGGPETERMVVDAFNQRYNSDLGSKIDLNQQGTETLTSLLVRRDPESLESTDLEGAKDHYGKVAAAIMGLRKDVGLLDSWETLGELGEVSPAVVSALRDEAALGEFSVLSAETVGSQIGSELRVKGILAVAFSIVGMLGYIWLRFELRFGIGAVVATFHDVLITLGLFALFGYEFNLTTIAAFLTVVGYSVNDTVVVFDRVRENLRRTRREPLEAVLNLSLNQTLSRTVLTSGSTLLAVGTLFLLGGDVIRGLAFVLLIGIVVGTYSSVFVASPIVLMWENMFGREQRARRATKAA
jgi:preprotein translocase subunit SecF